MEGRTQERSQSWRRAHRKGRSHGGAHTGKVAFMESARTGGALTGLGVRRCTPAPPRRRGRTSPRRTGVEQARDDRGTRPARRKPPRRRGLQKRRGRPDPGGRRGRREDQRACVPARPPDTRRRRPRRRGEGDGCECGSVRTCRRVPPPSPGTEPASRWPTPTPDRGRSGTGPSGPCRWEVDGPGANRARSDRRGGRRRSGGPGRRRRRSRRWRSRRRHRGEETGQTKTYGKRSVGGSDRLIGACGSPRYTL